jgi:hypothetical protein
MPEVRTDRDGGVAVLTPPAPPWAAAAEAGRSVTWSMRRAAG